MDKERQRQEDLQRIRGFRLIDDDFMNVCFDENIEGTELILRIILNRPDLSVRSVKAQKVMKNLLGRDIWLDINASDSDGNEFDIEIQRADKGAVERQIMDMGCPCNDGEHIVYVNGADRNSATELGMLMHDFFCTNPNEMHFKQLADKVRYFKEDEKGVAAMCKVMEEMRNETAEKMKIEIALRLIQQGKLALEDIVNVTTLTMEKVRELAGQKEG